MQAVAIVVNRNQGLQRGADVVELDFLRVQAAATGLHMVFEFLAAFICAIFVAHAGSPNAARHAAQHGVFGVHAIAKEEAQVGRKVVNVHAARQIRFYKCEAVRQRERQLAQWVGTRLGYVVAADRHAVKIAHLVVYKIFGNIAHDLQAEFGAENAGILPLVFFQNVGLHRAAHVFLHPFFDFGRFGVGGFAAIVGFEFV